MADYTLPPIIQSGSATGNGTTTIIAAPGAGYCIRLMGINIALSRTNTGLTNAVVNDSIIGLPVYRALGLSVPNGNSEKTPIWPYPGIMLTQNASLDMILSQSVVADGVFWCAYFYIDPQ